MALITAKPYSEMTLPELREQYMKFAEATKPGGFAFLHPSWHDVREILATWIARREREAVNPQGATHVAA